MGRGNRWSSAVAIPAFIVALSVGYVVSTIDELTSSRSAQDQPPVPLGVPRLADRVIVVVLDGVAVRVGRDRQIMPFVVELAASGASGVSRAPAETLTPTGVRALATGQSPSVIDALGIFRESEYKGWTVFDDVIRRGENVSVGGDKAWTSLLASRDPEGVRVTDVETRLYQHTDRVLANAAGRIASVDPPSLVVVHLSETDKFGHLYGTENPEYKKRMTIVDQQLRAFVSRVETPNTAFIITADHGNDVFGSHGGEEDIYRNVPIVMSGKGIRKGAKVSMDARALPGVIAVLLGTRIPGGMQAVIPVQAFALTESEQAAVVRANARQLQQLSAQRDVKLDPANQEGLNKIAGSNTGSQGDSVLPAAERLLASAVQALDAASPFNAARLLWAVVLVFGVLLVGSAMIASEKALGGVFETTLWIVMGVMVLLVVIPRLAIPLLWLTIAVEAFALAVRLGVGSRLGLLGFTGAIVVALLPVARFAYMPQIKASLRTQAGRFTSLAILVACGVAATILRRGRAISSGNRAEAYFFALVLLATALLKPFSPIAAMLLVITFAALRSSRLPLIYVGVIMVLLACFFAWSERAGFARYGEAPFPRYVYVTIACGTIAAPLVIWARDQRRWLALAWLCLVPLWPFGFLRHSGSATSPLSVLEVIIPLLLAAWIATLRVRHWWVYAGPVATIVYHLYPTHALFWLALAIHTAVIAGVAAKPQSHVCCEGVIALTTVSVLVLMSPAGDAPSVVLLALGLLAAGSLATQEMSPATVILVAGALLVFGRYALIGVFSHGQSLQCTLRCIDEAAGFLGFNETQWTWAGGLITLKMLFGSALLLGLVALNRHLYSAGEKLISAILLLVCAFVTGAAVDAGFSFGAYGSRLGIALGQAGYAVIILLSWVLGYLSFNAICRRRAADIRRAPAIV